jgi:hypothetical protein
VLEKLVDIQLQRVQTHKPLTYTEPGIKEVANQAIDKVMCMRVCQEFDGLLKTYKKMKLDGQFKEIFFVLGELDKVAELYEFIARQQTNELR